VPSPPEPVFFVDRSLGSVDVPAGLRAAGATVEVHDDHFPHTEAFFKVAKGVSRAGHTRQCAWNGVNYTDGCGWMVAGAGANSVFATQTRSLGGSAGVASSIFGIGYGLNPSGDAASVCAGWSGYPFLHCASWDEKILIAYASPDRTALNARLINTSGQLLGSEIHLTSGRSSLAHPQVAWVPGTMFSTGRWIVGYDSYEPCPGNYTRTVVVNFDGTVGQTNNVGWCGGMGCEGDPGDAPARQEVTLESQPGPLIDSISCYDLQLEAGSADGTSGPAVVAYQQYATWILDPNGAFLDGGLYCGGGSQSWGYSSATSMYDAPSGEEYWFRGAMAESNYTRLHVRPYENWWDHVDEAPYTSFGDVGTALSRTRATRQGYRGWPVLFSRYSQPNDLYLSVLNNWCPNDVCW
jgi:hypothetical protein